MTVLSRRAVLEQVLAGIWYAVLGFFALVLALPLIWLVTTSLKAGAQTFLMPPKWIPDPIVWRNYSDAFLAVAFHEYFWNTIRIVFFATTGALLTASMAAYAFARLRFPYRGPLFILVLSTIMLPSIVTLIPTFIVFRTLGWIDTFLPLIVPLWFGGGAFNIFLFRQFFMTIPLELDEAARIDGASSLRIYWGIILPLSKPVLATIAVFAFIHNWNDFFEPLIYLQSPENWTMAIGLRGFRTLYHTEWNLMMAASTAMIMPLLVLFFLAQRYFVSGIQMSGLAGR
ncbi:MAG: carbohydrate ABC transporter permease [Caldilineaceae bacterium]|nr:carbohydrate ABC transporter permease [Caldilineaceae bacterium]